MQSKTEICNGALMRAGHTERVANIDSEKSRAAEDCRDLWNVTVAAVLEGLNPSFARRHAKLAMLSGEDSFEYEYVFAYPSDCLMPHKVVTADYMRSKKADLSADIDFIKGQSKDGKTKTILTNIQEPYLIYTTGKVETHMFDSTFCIALSLLLGSNLALSLKKNPKLAQSLNSAYLQMISKSDSNDANAQSSDINYTHNFSVAAINARLS
ncbi:hypothetical protein ABKY54_004541 [Vibrio harveyi]